MAMHIGRMWFVLTSLAIVACLSGLAKPPNASSIEDVQNAVEKWLDGVTEREKAYRATLRASDDGSPLPSIRISDRLFAFQDDVVYVGIGFTNPPNIESTMSELRSTLKHIALDRLPVPGIDAAGWETRLQTPQSSFKEGVTIESWKDGVLCVRVQTEFFAVYGRRTDIVVPADAGMPKDSYFQIRRPIKADLMIEGRLFPEGKRSPIKN